MDLFCPPEDGLVSEMLSDCRVAPVGITGDVMRLTKLSYFSVISFCIEIKAPKAVPSKNAVMRQQVR